MGLDRWRKLGQRLASMDRAEAGDRLRQEFAKRQDAALARLGYDFSPNGQVREPAQRAGRFFFTADSVDSILALLSDRFPDYTDRTVETAERICRHQFDLLGYPRLDYGDPIDWRLDAVHGKRAPKKAFYRVRYLDYAEVGDSKITWELNRHQHFLTLAKAYRLRPDRRYADEIGRQWRHWQAENPYPVGINWASSLEVAFRSLSWIWTYHLLEGSRELSDFHAQLGAELRPGLALHGRHIERYLSTYFSPNTHLLGEGLALFFLGVLFPDLVCAERWKSLGWQIIVREAGRQVRGDGFHFEQSTYYHVYALDFFLHAAVLARANGIALPKAFEETIGIMLTALCLLARNGPPPRFGDDDGGRLFDPSRNRSEHLTDPLVTGAILFDRGDCKAIAGGLREEAVWLLGPEGVRQWDKLAEAEVPVGSAALPEAGLYLLAADRTQLVVDAGPLGEGRGGHGHADALSVTLQSHGRELLIDPGTFEYVGPGEEREIFRGTSMHNTLRVDERSQAETTGPFSWKRLTQSRTERWTRGRNFDLLICSHDGYERLDQPVTHRRSVVSLKNGIFLVRDVIQGQGRHRLDIAWHLTPKLELVEEGFFRSADAELQLAILPAREPNWRREVRREFWSPAYGVKAPTSMVNFSAEVELPTEFAALLVTSDQLGNDCGVFTRLADAAGDDEAATSYTYVAKGVDYLFVFGQAGKPWRTSSLSSDAEFVFRDRKLDKKEDHWILCGGSYARVEGGPELSCSRPVEWAEWVPNESGVAIYSSDPAAVASHATRTQQADPTVRRQL